MCSGQRVTPNACDGARHKVGPQWILVDLSVLELGSLTSEVTFSYDIPELLDVEFMSKGFYYIVKCREAPNNHGGILVFI